MDETERWYYADGDVYLEVGKIARSKVKLLVVSQRGNHELDFYADCVYAHWRVDSNGNTHQALWKRARIWIPMILITL